MNHDDILCTSIPSEEGKRRDLLEIAKQRAKGTFQMRDLHNAEKLYARCIEVANLLNEPDRHLLYSNRAAVRLLKSKHQLALDDCEACMDLDAAFIKAHFRKCQALVGLERFEDAISAAKTALEIHPGNKDLVDIQGTAEKKWEAQKAKPDPEKPTFDDYRPVRVEPASKAAKGGDGSAEGATSSTDSATKADEMRGYKKTADGRTTSYFHTELDENAKKLIGDCKPKQISADAQLGNKTTSAGSAWNQAGTFEERDYTKWFSEEVRKEVKGKFQVPDEAKTLSFSVTDVSGSAQITSSRGKVRYIHDSTIELKWKFPVNEDHTEYCKGTITFESDGAGDYDINYACTEKQHMGRGVVDKHVKGDASTLVKHIREKLQVVEGNFKALNPFK
ncbi:unnamed protein product [Amoebophrya sp. A120]|nr:unnamed protein product [Amoebophrya sp. A120]|eukprot:GSA120T00005325001.1